MQVSVDAFNVLNLIDETWGGAEQNIFQHRFPYKRPELRRGGPAPSSTG